MAEFVMPKLGADMSAGKLIAWRKKPGDTVSRGDIIADVETDKADIEVEVFTTGVIDRLLVQAGDKVAVGTVLAIIREEGKPLDVVAPSTIPSAAIPRAEAPPPSKAVITAGRAEPVRIRISPAARKLAAELGVDPLTATGTGPAGRITREDIERAAAAKTPVPFELEAAIGRQARMRQAIAAAMARSKREIPHYYLSTTIDMTRVMQWLADENLKRSVENRLLYGVLLIKAVALALREVPELNSTWTEGRAVPSADINVGVAISLRGGGLVAPALHNTDRQSVDELMKSFLDLVKRARGGTLRSSELSDPTITVTSLGEQGVEAVFGIIYPPQVALVGFGKIVERPRCADGQIAARPTVIATLSGDHRVSDGHRGALFLSAVDRLLQEPGKL
ncbi:MAG TPA: dihydrolipoamide acetyltransferase family protein [Blastocatellia bacterium]|nr:dihydrolipoamide acetyltransferase family protein [Blastocatellia bacterium]